MLKLEPVVTIWAALATSEATGEVPPLGPRGSTILATFVVLIAVASLATWLALWQHYRRRGYLLRMAERAPVPWGPVGLILACLFVIQAVAATWSERESISRDEFLTSALAATALYAVIGAGIVGFLRLAGASWGDLGMPATWRDAAADVRVGVIALLAAFPVYFVQALLVQVAGQSSHPLLVKLQQEPSTELFLVALLTASVVAPLFEELIFRLLLQGWLEKVAQRSPALGESARRAGPILLSSLLFALAHLSHGPDPVALFLLALVLGYVYQRTHRLLPCIVLHSLFNASSLLVLWLALWSDAV